LGDGLTEYTDPVRFAGERGPLVPGATSAPLPAKKRRKLSGMAWVFVGLLIFFIGAAAFTAIVSPMRNRVGRVHTPERRSYAGVQEWNTAENNSGVTFESVSPPGGPADKAGLIGGDVIVSFDGRRVNNEDEMSRLMVQTPVGKTVDVEYIRDGETHVTKLTTVSEQELERLSRAFGDRPPDQRAQLGYDSDDVARVAIPGTKMYGIRLDDVYAGRPADIAGVRNGDIVIEWDGIPIRTGDELLMRVNRAVPYSTVKLVVMRGGPDALERVEIPVKMARRY
jgi:S1-C subfamily serine protease